MRRRAAEQALNSCSRRAVAQFKSLPTDVPVGAGAESAFRNLRINAVPPWESLANLMGDALLDLGRESRGRGHSGLCSLFDATLQRVAFLLERCRLSDRSSGGKASSGRFSEGARLGFAFGERDSSCARSAIRSTSLDPRDNLACERGERFVDNDGGGRRRHRGVESGSASGRPSRPSEASASTSLRIEAGGGGDLGDRWRTTLSL